MLAVGLIRSSKATQELTPFAQREAIETWCINHEMALVALYEDIGVSGGSPIEKRPGLLAALDYAKREKATLVVAKWDRLSRDNFVSELVLKELNGRVQSADGTGNEQSPESNLMRGIVQQFAVFERALIKSRTKKALDVKKAKKQRTGNIPFGFHLAEDKVHIEEDPQEQRVIAMIKGLRRGRYPKSIRNIVNRLNESGIKARGKKWYYPLVYKILKKEGMVHDSRQGK